MLWHKYWRVLLGKLVSFLLGTRCIDRTTAYCALMLYPELSDVMSLPDVPQILMMDPEFNLPVIGINKAILCHWISPNWSPISLTKVKICPLSFVSDQNLFWLGVITQSFPMNVSTIDGQFCKWCHGVPLENRAMFVSPAAHCIFSWWWLVGSYRRHVMWMPMGHAIWTALKGPRVVTD